YEEKAIAKNRVLINSLANSTTAKDLQPLIEQMPREWLENIYKAAIGAREARIKEAIAIIPADLKPLSDNLTEMVDRLDFDAIVTLVEPLI
nr:hypothetical protein [Prochloraceae cyanobacterium]